MKVKVSVPSEPLCTIKLEIDEAKALLAKLGGLEGVIVSQDIINVTIDGLKVALAGALGLTEKIEIEKEPSLFDETEKIIKSETNKKDEDS